ncbi:MAG: bifunctional UDP-N-acetylmuramoyl-tripeptide:D-alanyl-D-alanine ligase/alanine racemase, partial [Pelobium sp.]
AGVKSFVITQGDFPTEKYPDANFIWVKDSLKAMQQLAIDHREHYHYPVIGVTGSNGKTIVKEWLFQLLATDYKVVRSPKSYNSQIGVPLSVWQMSEEDELAIFEAGISKPDEMELLEQMIRPNIGILTNISSPHDEGFKNRAEKLTEKLKLFKDSDVIILNSQYIGESLKNKKTFSWSLDGDADLRVIDIEKQDRTTNLKAIYKQELIEIKIPFNNLVSIENAVICWATLLYLNVNQKVICRRMSHLLAVKMRLELKSGIHHSSIIDDSYNSDYSSLDIAIDFLNQQQQHPTKTLILSDIHQTGIPANELYQNVAQLLAHKGVDKFIGIGEELLSHQEYFKIKSWFYKSTDDFLENHDRQLFRNETILIKGARQFEFERISQVLTQKVHDTVLEINLNALTHNLNHYKSKLSPGVKLMAMVKAFAYGSGSDEIANLLQHNSVDYLAVAYADEGVSLRQAGIKIPIMVLSPEVSSFETMLSHQLEPEIYSFRILHAYADFLVSENVTSYPVHIKLDTGMHRLGFNSSDIEKLGDFLAKSEVLKVKSVFSHLAASDSDVHVDYTKQQFKTFDEGVKTLESKLNYSFMKHISNTSAITKWPEAQYDMVRLGIGLYGVESLIAERNSLQNVATLKTTISQIKYLKKGDTVGYGRKGVMLRDGKIATVKIGYADGYARILGNGVGTMMINNQEVPTIGNICMDMTMLDLTDIEVKEDDEVIVFGAALSVYEVAEKMNTIPYEVLTNISQRVKRVYFYE